MYITYILCICIYQYIYKYIIYIFTERRLCLYCMLAHERPPDVWYTFSQDFTTKDCINVLEPEKTCEYYNLNLTEKYCHSQRRNVTQSKTRK